MQFSHSARYLPQNEWSDALRSRAVDDANEIDLQACLEAFRQHDAFYAKRLAGITAWHDVPPLQKSELAAVPVNHAQRLHETRSSGTTGDQTVIKNTTAERRFRQALAYRPLLFYPVTPTPQNIVRQLIFADGTDVDRADKEQWPFAFGGRTYLTWRVGIAAAPDLIHELLQSIRPHIVRGLTSGIVRFVEELQRPLDDLGVQVVSPSGEELPDTWRNSLNETFAAPVLDRYGATETGAMAWQCPYCHSYHVNSDEILLEESPAGVLATPLFINSQPLLRYQLEDRIVLGEPELQCRVRLPTLKLLEARRDDWIINGAGQNVSPLSFQFESIAGLNAWRLHQLNTGKLCLHYDAEEKAADVRGELADQLQRIVPGREFELTEGVWNSQQDGKFKRVTSDLI